MEPQRLVIGAFGPFGGKWLNNAELVSQRLEQRHAAGQLKIPDQVEVHFLPLDCSPEGVQSFVHKAQELNPDRVLVMGESGFRTRIETRAFDRGVPSGLLQSTLKEMVPGANREGELATTAPVEQMARNSGSFLSHDAGEFYCNYAYHSALSAGLNALFVHVPSGLLGLALSTNRATDKVEQILETWYLTK